MPRKSPNLTIEEISGNQYNSLEEAQKAALKATAADLVQIIRARIESGDLIIVNGKVVPNPERSKQQQERIE
jgi:hypothetical protein